MSENPYAPYTVTRIERDGEATFSVSGPALSLEYDDPIDANRVAFAAAVAFNAGKSEAVIIDGSPKNPAAFEALYRACNEFLHMPNGVHLAVEVAIRQQAIAALALADKGVGQ